MYNNCQLRKKSNLLKQKKKKKFLSWQVRKKTNFNFLKNTWYPAAIFHSLYHHPSLFLSPSFNGFSTFQHTGSSSEDNGVRVCNGCHVISVGISRCLMCTCMKTYNLYKTKVRSFIWKRLRGIGTWMLYSECIFHYSISWFSFTRCCLVFLNLPLLFSFLVGMLCRCYFYV